MPDEARLAQAILAHWQALGPAGWYAGTPEIDAAIRAAFAPAWAAARDGGHTGWLATAEGALAYLLLTDQFPRNMFRDDPRAFATDALALAAAGQALARGHDLATPEPLRQFFYLPLMHAEDPAAQGRCCRLFAERMPLTGADNLRHARAHAWVIARFGRFPYRNAALGRAEAAGEAGFLAAGGYRAALAAIDAEDAAAGPR